MPAPVAFSLVVIKETSSREAPHWVVTSISTNQLLLRHLLLTLLVRADSGSRKEHFLDVNQMNIVLFRIW